VIRFFAAPGDISGNLIKLSHDDEKHIRSLRLRPNENFIVCDGNGTDYICVLSQDGDHKTARIKEQKNSPGEPSVLCKAYIAFSKGDRLDYAVQKSVELGVNEVILFKADRCVAIPNDITKKIARLGRISLETAKQCGRGIIPVVSYCGGFTTALSDAVSSSGLSVLLYEDEKEIRFSSVLTASLPVLHEPMIISTITGPEGGFEPFEIKQAQELNIPVVTLGPRILRSETAPVAALAAIMYETGNL